MHKRFWICATILICLAVFGESQEKGGGEEKQECGGGTQDGRRLAGRECSDCYAGQYSMSDGESDICVLCPAGYYQRADGQRECELCPAGKFSSTAGLTDCDTCAEGTYMPKEWSGEGRLCITCLTGAKGAPDKDGNMCTPDSNLDCLPTKCPGQCLPGQKDNSGRAICDVCPVDASRILDPTGENRLTVSSDFTIKGSDDKSCESCPPGFFGDGLQPCASCEKGKYSNSNFTECIFCQAGFWSDTTGASDNSTCKACVPGRYVEGRGASSNTSCVDCGPGKYMTRVAASHSSMCKLCPVGRVSHPDNVGNQTHPKLRTRDCINCTAGKYMDIAGYTGVPKQNVSEVTCKDCPLGRVAPNVNENMVPRVMGSCDQCSPGKYMNQTGNSDCVKCAPGTKQKKLGQTNCGACPRGWSTVDFDEMAVCIKCASGKFAHANGSAACTDCPEGYYGDLMEQRGCKICDQGKYSDEAGKAGCIACQAGKYAHEQGQERCEKCDKGQYRPSTVFDASTCLVCPRGWYQDSTGQASCLPCIPGQFGNDTKLDACFQCAQGKVSEIAATSCVDCPKGYHQDSTGQASCLPCVPGQFGNGTGLHACFQCARGKVSEFANASVCTDCDAGQSSDAKGSAKCTACGAGQYSDVQGEACKNCAAGQYRVQNPDDDANDPTSCVDCPKGYHQDSTSQASCLPCLPGQFGNGTGLHACFECARGKVSEFANASVCTDCVAGQSSDAKGSAKCTACGAGQYSDVQGEACKNCAAGQYRVQNPDDDANDPTSCVDCPKGYHQDSTSQASCLPCLPGKFADVPGLAVCKNCDPGKFQSAINSSACSQVTKGWIAGAGASSEIEVAQGFRAVNCTGDVESDDTMTCTKVEPCPAGTKGAKPPTTRCESCALGETSFGSSLNCNPCDKGKYGVEGQHGGMCEDCPIGFYQDKAGQRVCVGCPIGWKQENVGSQACVDMGAESPEDCVEFDEYLDRSAECAEDDFECMKEKYKCKPCPLGADCQLNSDHLNTKAKSGFWKVDSPLFLMNPDPGNMRNAVMQPCPYVKRCNNKDACAMRSANDSAGSASTVNSTTTSESGFAQHNEDNSTTAAPQQCCEGINTEFPLCAVCKIGWRKTSTGECVKCAPSTQTTDTIMLAIMLLVFIAAMIGLNRVMKRYGHVIRILWLDMMRVVAIMINFTQISTSVNDTISVSWPDNFLQHLDVFSFVNMDFLDLTGFACSVRVTQKGKALFACLVVTVLVSTAILGLVLLNVKLKSRLVAFSKGKNSGQLEKLWKVALRKAFDLVDEDANGTMDVDELAQVLKVTQVKGDGNANTALLETNSDKAGTKAGATNAGTPKAAVATASTLPDIKNWKMTSIIKADKVSNKAFLRRRSRASVKLKKAHSEAEHLFMKWKGDTQAELTCNEFLRFMGSEKSESTTAKMVSLVRWERKSAITTSVLGTVGQVAFVLHAPISKTLFQWFNCRDIGTKAYVKMDFSTQCGTTDYVATSVLFMAFILGFSVGLPVAVFTFMFVKRKKLHNAKTLATAGWLYNRYQKGVEWWEVHELLRKLILCSAIVFIPQQLKVPFAILVSLTAMTSLNRFHPQKNGLVFKVALIAFTATCAKFISAIVVRAAVAEGDEKLRNQVGLYLVVQDILIYTFSSMAIVLLTLFLVQKVRKVRVSNIAKKGSVVVPKEMSVLPKPSTDRNS